MLLQLCGGMHALVTRFSVKMVTDSIALNLSGLCRQLLKDLTGEKLIVWAILSIGDYPEWKGATEVIDFDWSITPVYFRDLMIQQFVDDFFDVVRFKGFVTQGIDPFVLNIRQVCLAALRGHHQDRQVGLITLFPDIAG